MAVIAHEASPILCFCLVIMGAVHPLMSAMQYVCLRIIKKNVTILIHLILKIFVFRRQPPKD